MEAFEEAYKKSFPFWKDISENEREYLCRHSTRINYSKGTTIHDGTDCSGVFFIRSGCLRVYIMSEEGKTVTLYRLHAGDMCMLSASCVIQAITFDVLIDAEEDSECYVISSSAFASVSESNPQIKIFALELAVTRFSDVMWVMQQILFMSLDKRLAIFLSDESARLDSDIIPLTHEQIAKYMGSAREVVSRMLKYFSNEGIIESSRKEVKILDKQKLRRLIL
ncbi:MAG: Crp/Fnr family transcriptional regulator [Oscillospiraceae bacterium]|nr:Crp/Fnr family transcriptional regulator [Oscillospiraceae bacterium]